VEHNKRKTLGTVWYCTFFHERVNSSSPLDEARSFLTQLLHGYIVCSFIIRFIILSFEPSFALNRFLARPTLSHAEPFTIIIKYEQLRCRTRFYQFYSLMRCHDYSWCQKCTKIDRVMTN
jgi:hypothetical protein